MSQNEPPPLSEQVAAEKKEQDFLPDSPCWGSPDHHDLETLLAHYRKCDSAADDDTKKKTHELVLYESSNYVILNKPPDVRMDGPYRTTVERLLYHWYQTTFRPCHQLDYATSGVLCYARSKKAAAFAQKQWEARQVTKSYVAILQLNATPDDNTTRRESAALPISNDDKWERWSDEQVRHRLAELERIAHRQRRQERLEQRQQHAKDNPSPTAQQKPTFQQRRTFQGCHPPHTLFQKWKSAQLLQQKQQDGKSDNGQREEDHGTTKKRRRDASQSQTKNSKQGTHLTADDWKDIYRDITVKWEQETKQQEDTNSVPAILNTNWKEFKHASEKNLQEWKILFQHASIRHNELLWKRLQEEERPNDPNDENIMARAAAFPTVFRNDTDDSVWYVSCPVATHPDRFSMAVPRSMEANHPHVASFVPSSSEEEDGLDFKLAVTKIQFIDGGSSRDSDTSNKRQEAMTFEEIAIAKVRLWPLTGRRHQLRVHMAVLGHAILGDITYQQQEYKNQAREQTARQRRSAPRMCLHAHYLSLKLLEDPNWNVTAPDPFVLDTKGRLLLSTAGVGGDDDDDDDDPNKTNT